MTRTAMARAFAHMLLAFALFSCVLALSALARSQQSTDTGEAKAPSNQSSVPKIPSSVSKATLAQFAWLAGRWQGQWGPRVAQQVWMPPQSGEMVGVFQLSEDSHTSVVELYAILSTPRGIELRVRHFTPSLTPWETSRPTLLNLKSIDPKSILFENADNGQPKHWLMRRTNADTFLARFEIVPEKGQQAVAEIVYHRQPGSDAASH